MRRERRHATGQAAEGPGRGTARGRGADIARRGRDRGGVGADIADGAGRRAGDPLGGIRPRAVRSFRIRWPHALGLTQRLAMRAVGGIRNTCLALVRTLRSEAAGGGDTGHAFVVADRRFAAGPADLPVQAGGGARGARPARLWMLCRWNGGSTVVARSPQGGRRLLRPARASAQPPNRRRASPLYGAAPRSPYLRWGAIGAAPTGPDGRRDAGRRSAAASLGSRPPATVLKRMRGRPAAGRVWTAGRRDPRPRRGRSRPRRGA